MERERSDRVSTERALEGSEATSRTAISLGVPQAGSLLLTYGVVSLLCRTPWPASLTWPTLIRTAVVFLLITMAAHVSAVWANRRLFREQIDAPLRLLIFAIWPAVVWLPLLVLLIRQRSVGVLLVLPLISASAVFSLKRWVGSSREPRPILAEAGELSTLFDVQTPQPLLRSIAPALLTSIALEGAIAELARGRLLASGSILAACMVYPIWTYPMKLEDVRSGGGSPVRAAVPRTLAVLLLVGIALIPYLRSSGLSGALSALLQTSRSPVSVSSPRRRASSRAPGDAYSGVILVLPPKPHREIVPPPLAPVRPSSFARKPVIIPFDGAYWYFKQPDQRPRDDAPVVRGDPIKRNIHSTDMRPISMEAHQRLNAPIRMDCCRSLRLAVQNADNRPGAISVEVLLRDRTSHDSAGRSLGRLVIPSSESQHISLTRLPVDEVLSFPFPPRSRGRQMFDEITVVIQPSRERARAGAHVAVQSFELVP